jgi:transcriptional regulator with XRE-family HTH domain
MPESFGARLRRQRENHGIALEALAQQTRIKESLLEALERDDLSQWPTGFYRRAFFRAYAAAIQLDPDAAFNEFQQLYPEPPADDVLAAMAATLGVEQKRDRTGIRTVVESAISSLARLRSSVAADSGPPSVDPRKVAEAPDAASAVASAEVTRGLSEQAEGRPDPPENKPLTPSEPEINLAELARLCVELGCVTTEGQARALLSEAARLLRASGLIVWALNPRAMQLEAALVHGYSPKVVAQLPRVKHLDGNATAEAWRTLQTRVLGDCIAGKAAIAAPLRTAMGCVGVFAVELQSGVEPTADRIAMATLLSATLAPLAESLSQPAEFTLPTAINSEMQTV